MYSKILLQIQTYILAGEHDDECQKYHNSRGGFKWGGKLLVQL